MNRRQLLKTGALIGASSLSSYGSILHHYKKRPLGVALVGLGNYATRQLAPALQQTTHCQLKGIVTGTSAKAIQWKKDFQLEDRNVYDYQSFDEIADNDEIDIVYIVLPNFMHAEYTIRGLEAGKHVICEKPMGMSAPECRQMIAAQKKSERKLQIGYRLYYQPHHLAIRNIGVNNTWGKTKLLEAGLGFRMASPGSWRLDKAMGGGGALMDLGLYCIQAARRFTGELPSAVSAQGFVDDRELFKDIYETYLFQLQFPSGAVCNVSTSFNAYVDRFHAACEEGWLTLSPSFNAGRVPELTSSPQLAAISQDSAYQQVAQLDAFALNIMNDTTVLASGEEGLIDMQIIDGIKLALESQSSTTLVYD